MYDRDRNNATDESDEEMETFLEDEELEEDESGDDDTNDDSDGDDDDSDYEF